MNQFVYILSLKNEFRNKENWTGKQDTIVSEHFQYLLELKEKNVLLVAGKTQYDIDSDENFGVVIFQATSLEKATMIMQNDPALKKNLMTAELHPFSLAAIKD